MNNFIKKYMQYFHNDIVVLCILLFLAPTNIKTKAHRQLLQVFRFRINIGGDDHYLELI